MTPIPINELQALVCICTSTNTYIVELFLQVGKFPLMGKNSLYILIPRTSSEESFVLMENNINKILLKQWYLRWIKSQPKPLRSYCLKLNWQWTHNWRTYWGNWVRKSLHLLHNAASFTHLVPNLKSIFSVEHKRRIVFLTYIRNPIFQTT